METRLKIGEFAKLTGVTVKTILHYHKIGLLTEPARSPGGYRLYGVRELNHMRSIKRLKSLGLRLDQIKEILGYPAGHKADRAVLLSLQAELQSQIKILQERAKRIGKILEENQDFITDDNGDSSLFKMIIDILGEEAQEQYKHKCPELYDQERQLYGVMDELDWGFDFQDLLKEIAEYFRHHPEEYQISLSYGDQITAIKEMDPDCPQIEELARNYAAFIRRLPFTEKLLSECPELNMKMEQLWMGMCAEVYTPSQMKLLELLNKYIVLEKS